MRGSDGESIDLKNGVLFVEALHFGLENGDNAAELILVAHEAASEVAQRVLEEGLVVRLVEHARLYIADQILEERADHHVHNLADFEVDLRGYGRPGVEHLEILAARDVLLRSLQIQLVQRSVGELARVYRRSEVERDIVHEEPVAQENMGHETDWNERERILTT